MKILILSVALLCAVLASADTYCGTFTGTVTTVSPNSFGYIIGDTFSGFYQYDSLTPDVDILFMPWAENKMGVYLPNEFWRPFDGPSGLYFDQGTFSPWPQLVVVDGCVTDFSISNQNALATYGFNENTWGLAVHRTANENEHFSMSGTVSICDPVLMAVPDSTSTAPLLIAGLLGLAAFLPKIGKKIGN